MDAPKTTALAPWYGSNRMLAHAVGEELAGCRWVGVPFAGGMSELLHIRASVVLVNDLHSHVINLARVAADPVYGPRLYRRLRRLPFHPATLAAAQDWCNSHDAAGLSDTPVGDGHLAAAEAYYVAAWMGRSAKAGTDGEFSGQLAKRWDGNGGGSAVRYCSSVASLPAWRRILRRCEFTVMDGFTFLAKCRDAARHGVYCDPPFPGPGDKYRHKFTPEHHNRLAATLAAYRDTRVVCRFYDHAAIRELYPEPHWTWRRLAGRTQANADAPEVLVINGPSREDTNGRL